MKCRHCQHQLTESFCDLQTSPPSNSFLRAQDLDSAELYYPLKVFICTECFLVQIAEVKKSVEIFNEEYIYFSSFSKSWLAHAKIYSDMISKKLLLSDKSLVAEIASNDGYLLKNFVAAGIPCFGIEPTKNTAQAAKAIGVPVIEDFFGVQLAEKLDRENKKVDLLIGNNVLAHVPDINDFVKGLKILLKPSGTITIEFPHLLNILKENQFDTIYHEHYSYLSLGICQKIFKSFGLRIYDVEQLPTHGGSLRIYATHDNNRSLPTAPSVEKLNQVEIEAGLYELKTYQQFQSVVEKIKVEVLQFLLNAKMSGHKVVGYGAAAKGNTLLNFCGVRSDLIEFVADVSSAKVGKFLPGSRIEVRSKESIKDTKPDFILILPWNLKQEIIEELSDCRQWGCRFVTFIPNLQVI